MKRKTFLQTIGAGSLAALSLMTGFTIKDVEAVERHDPPADLSELFGTKKYLRNDGTLRVPVFPEVAFRGAYVMDDQFGWTLVMQANSYIRLRGSDGKWYLTLARDWRKYTKREYDNNVENLFRTFKSWVNEQYEMYAAHMKVPTEGPTTEFYLLDTNQEG